MNMNLLIDVRHDIFAQCNGNYIGMKIINNMLKINILKICSNYFGDAISVGFLGGKVSKITPRRPTG